MGKCATGQATDGVSLGAQRERIRSWSRANGYEGAKASNRLGLRAALAQAQQTKAALAIYSLSRLARSTRDAIAISESLAQSGVELVSLSEKIDTTSAAGKMVFRMLAVLAEFERDVIAERTCAAMQHKRSKGERVSREAAYGSRLTPDGRVEADPTERRAVERVAELHAAGWSLRKIAAALPAAVPARLIACRQNGTRPAADRQPSFSADLLEAHPRSQEGQAYFLLYPA